MKTTVLLVLFALCVAAPTAAVAQNDWERFDLSGLPPHPTTFLEQQIRALIADHQPGDRAGAAVIQGKLARWYEENGDAARARTAERRAHQAAAHDQATAAAPQVAPATTPPSDPPEARDATTVAVAEPAKPKRATAAPALTGSYFGMDGRTLHTWDFSPDGTFHHSVVSRGAGTSVRSGERGRFEIDGKTLVLHVESAATGFATPGVGGRSTLLGGGSDSASEVRRLGFQALGPNGSDGIVLEGVRLKPRSW